MSTTFFEELARSLAATDHEPSRYMLSLQIPNTKRTRYHLSLLEASHREWLAAEHERPQATGFAVRRTKVELLLVKKLLQNHTVKEEEFKFTGRSAWLLRRAIQSLYEHAEEFDVAMELIGLRLRDDPPIGDWYAKLVQQAA